MEKKAKTQKRMPKPKNRPKYEPPKVVTYQEDEFLKQFGKCWEICPPPTCKE